MGRTRAGAAKRDGCECHEGSVGSVMQRCKMRHKMRIVTKGAEVVQNARPALLILHRVFHIHLSHLNIDKKDIADLPMI